MKVTVLVDNNTIIDRYFTGEPGAAYFIEDGAVRLLFDTGYSGIFINNAYKLGIDLRQIDAVVLSHGHNDHTGGLSELIKLYSEAPMVVRGPAELVAHPLAFAAKSYAGQDIGCLFSVERLRQHFNLRLSAEPLWLTDRLVFLGEVERHNDFEARSPLGKRQGLIEEDDFLPDDSALVFKAAGGLVIITGCSHAGICNIIRQAQIVCQDERIIDILGGLHLLNPTTAQLAGTVEYLRRIRPAQVHAGHCTDLASKIRLAQVVSLAEVGVGLTLQYD